MQAFVKVDSDSNWQTAGDGGDIRWGPKEDPFSDSYGAAKAESRELSEDVRQQFGGILDDTGALLSGLLRLRQIDPELSAIWTIRLTETLERFSDDYDQALRASNEAQRASR